MGFLKPELPDDASVTVSKEQWEGATGGRVSVFLVGAVCGAVLMSCMSTDEEKSDTPTKPTTTSSVSTPSPSSSKG